MIVPIPAPIDDLLTAVSRHRGLSAPVAAGLASIVRSIMRAYAGPRVDPLQLVKALKKIGKWLGAEGSQPAAVADAAALADLRSLARLLEREVDGAVDVDRVVDQASGARVPRSSAGVGSGSATAVEAPRAPAPQPGRPFVLDIAAEHLDEAGFCFIRWQRALRAPDYTPAEVEQGPEERLGGHLDALVIGGRPVAETLLLPALGEGDPEARFAAAWCLIASEDGDYADPVIDALGAAEDAGDEPARRAIAGALALSRAGAIVDRLTPVLAGARPAARSEAARLLVRRLAAPEDVRRWLAADDAALVAGALRGLTGDVTPWTEWLDRHLRSPDPVVRCAAMMPGLCAGLVAAWDQCVDGATGADPSAEDLIPLATLGGAAEHAAIERALPDPASRRTALFALGFSGRRRAAELCLEVMGHAMSDGDLTAARVAAESFAAITGLGLTGEFVRPEPSQGDDPDDARGATDAEARLPLPNEPAIRAWWSAAAPRFQSDQRYLGGTPLAAAGLVAAIASGSMRRRPGYALELAVRTRGALFIDTTDWVFAQRAALAAAAIPRALDFSPLFGAG